MQNFCFILELTVVLIWKGNWLKITGEKPPLMVIIVFAGYFASLEENTGINQLLMKTT